MSNPKPELIRGLTLRDTTSLVVGTIIGTGVFLKTAKMSQAAGSPELVLLAWVAAGLLSLAGALTYAELGALLPQAGGEYAFLRKAYGDLPAFLFGWMRIVVGSTGSIAIFGVAFSIFLSDLISGNATLYAALNQVWAHHKFSFFGQPIDWQFGPKQIISVGVILLFSAVNCLKVVFGGKVQSILTFGKVAGIAAIIVGVFFFAPTASWEHLRAPENAAAWCGFAKFGVAMMGAMWAFDGWNNMPMVAGEVKNPERNIPLALMFGMFIVLAVYGLVNVAYFYALPFSEIITASSTLHGEALSVASKAAKSFFANGPILVSVAALLSTIGVLNGSILTSARVPYAMARDGLFFSSFASLNAAAVPVRAILFQAIWASILALSATFDQLTDGVVFAGLIFYAATTAAVFVLRKKMPNAPRRYKTWGYPVVPIVFVLASIWLLNNTLRESPLESKIGLGLILLGLPIYFFLKRTKTA